MSLNSGIALLMELEKENRDIHGATAVLLIAGKKTSRMKIEDGRRAGVACRYAGECHNNHQSGICCPSSKFWSRMKKTVVFAEFRVNSRPTLEFSQLTTLELELIDLRTLELELKFFDFCHQKHTSFSNSGSNSKILGQL